MLWWKEVKDEWAMGKPTRTKRKKLLTIATCGRMQARGKGKDEWNIFVH